jgi:hypothetical protein
VKWNLPINEAEIRDHLSRIVKGTIEDTINQKLEDGALKISEAKLIVMRSDP